MDTSKLVAGNLEFYHTVKPNNPENSYTVLATINDYTTGQLLALATGTQANLRTYPNDIEDCHAESLVKRAYKRYLIETVSNYLSELADLKEAEKIIREKCSQDLILFISQFPCGLIKRYEGDEPVDEHGVPIKRKPGRGTVKDGKIVYVNRDNCTTKLARWLREGFQGRRLKQLFGIQCFARKIVIGDCEPDESFDYKQSVEDFKKHVGADIVPDVELVDKIRCDELLFSASRQPQPVALAWWLSSSGSLKSAHRVKRRKTEPCPGAFELIVDGRKRGITKKQCLRGSSASNLQICSYTIREELDKIEQTFYKNRSGV